MQFRDRLPTRVPRRANHPIQPTKPRSVGKNRRINKRQELTCQAKYADHPRTMATPTDWVTGSYRVGVRKLVAVVAADNRAASRCCRPGDVADVASVGSLCRTVPG